MEPVSLRRLQHLRVGLVTLRERRQPTSTEALCQTIRDVIGELGQ